MWYPWYRGPADPTTFEEWTVIGCGALIVFLGLVALALYVNIRTGFRNLEAVGLLGSCAGIAAVALLIRHFIRRWIDQP